MDNVTPYDKLNSDGKAARKAFSSSYCIHCFANKENKCNKDVFDVCLNAFTKGFMRGVKHHRKVIKQRNK